MARSMIAWLRAAAVAVLVAQTVAQKDAKCYYPNHIEAPSTEKPCSSAPGSACCPDTWECLDNGLCHLPTGNQYGSYSCTDKDWEAPGCPSNMCMYPGGRVGGESILQCKNHNNEWCCNANAQDVHCCEGFPVARPFFQLQDGRAYATVGSSLASTAPIVSSITMLISGSGGGSAPSRAPSPSSAAQSSDKAATTSRASATPSPVISVSRSVSSGSAGLTTIESTFTSTPSATVLGVPPNDDPASSGGSKSNLGVIIGCAVGIPMALALVGILFWLLRKRRNQKVKPYPESPELEGSPGKAGFAGGAGAKFGKDVYRHSRPGTTEIDGAPIGAVPPVSNIPGHAELATGAGFQPGNGPAFAPDAVGLGGGSGNGRATWGSAPPGYSPGMNQAGFVHPPNAMELADTSVLPVINEKDAPQQYQAYRPPQPTAELPTVKTPPEDVEKQLQR